jgi:MYXO-CTERM domain-containing protein
LDTESWHFHRVAAVRDRSLLGEDLRGLPLSGSPGRDLTPVMVSAIQWVLRSGAQGGRVHHLLMPPPDKANKLDSATLPIRVTYGDAQYAALARTVLQATERSWTVERDDYGFYEPPIERAANRYRVFIDDTGMGGGAYTAPYDYVNTTDWDDCYSYIVFDKANDQWGAGSIMAHEINHAMQIAMDCEEVPTFMENTATYIMGQVYDAHYEIAYMIPYFQRQPWTALDYMNQDESDLYEYGGVLFSLFLTSAYAPQEGPVLMREFWEATMQTSGINEPDYFDAIPEVVARRGGPADLESIFADFTEARYFLGENDDGAHIPNARSYWDGEPAVSARHAAGSLPVTNGQPPRAKRPATYGANFVVLNLGTSFTQDLRVNFAAADTARWNVRAVLTGGSAPTQSVPVPLDPVDLTGSVVVQPQEGHRDLVIVVANLAKANYDPDRGSWPVSDYFYSLESLPRSTVTRVTPQVLVRGTEGVNLQVEGTGFVAGDGFGVSFDDVALSVASVNDVQETSIGLTLAVPWAVTVGPKSITVHNANGSRTSGTNVLTVVDPPDAGVTPDGAGGGGSEDDVGGGAPWPPGCGCSESGPGSPWRGALATAGFLLLVLRRRRR